MKDPEHMTAAFEKIMADIEQNKHKILDDFAKAYLAETGLKIEEIELCQQTFRPEFTPGVALEVRFFFRKHSPLPRVQDNSDITSPLPWGDHGPPQPPAKVASAERRVEYLMKLQRMHLERLKVVERQRDMFEKETLNLIDALNKLHRQYAIVAERRDAWRKKYEELATVRGFIRRLFRGPKT